MLTIIKDKKRTAIELTSAQDILNNLRFINILGAIVALGFFVCTLLNNSAGESYLTIVIFIEFCFLLFFGYKGLIALLSKVPELEIDRDNNTVKLDEITVGLADVEILFRPKSIAGRYSKFRYMEVTIIESGREVCTFPVNLEQAKILEQAFAKSVTT